MSETVTLIATNKLHRNRENPRLIFREEELLALERSIADQGILVPLTVFKDGSSYYLLDGERRWKCALKIGLNKVPVIIQPKPDRMTNIMMMFAIHNARRDWDPLPTAMKLAVLEQEFAKKYKRDPNETELAGIASLPRGEVRRLKKLLRLPESYRKQLLKELEKPRSEQRLTVDHVIEAGSAAEALRKRELLSPAEEIELRDAIISKFRTGVINNTVAPRKLVRLSRAVERGEVERPQAKRIINKLISDDRYSVDAAYEDTARRSDAEHTTVQLIDRVTERLAEFSDSSNRPSTQLRNSLRALRDRIDAIIR
jgi:ParB family chromosome partitioning protein